MSAMTCTRCPTVLIPGAAHPRINGQPYCSRDCYEQAMREKGLTR